MAQRKKERPKSDTEVLVAVKPTRKIKEREIVNDPWKQKPRREYTPELKPIIIEKPLPPTPPAGPHRAIQSEPLKLTLPNLKDFPVNLVELPRAILNLSGEDLFNSGLGESDKVRIITLHNLLKKGYSVKQVQFTERNTVVFVLEK